MRLYGVFIALMPILGALSNGIFHGLGSLLLVGICANIFGFVQNDYFDIEIDKKSGYVADRPLASGLISKNEAMVFLSILFFISVLVTFFFFSYLSLLFLLLYFIFYTIYNKYSKKFAWMEYFLGLSASMIFLSGAFSYSNKISLLCLLLSFLPILKYAFNVGISANLKDIKYDLMQGVKTTPVIFGATVNDTIHIPDSFKIYGYSLKIIFVFISFIAILLTKPFISLFLFVATTMLIFYTLPKIFENIEKRRKMLFYAEIHEILTYILMASILFDYVAIHANAFLSFSIIILPPLWILTCLKIFFAGKPLE